ncbi:hypothetical protein ACHHYP_09024 [Achlya hypogyna]|uniref:Uncharacterized protein n=1 Tax=Achlya hypogyna TaxID=1202772 RepID=A0A1V9ZJQ5_ACHHY|nr:hypothetical protein ACHHYP_09024 [Achlya hypogyna]
MALHVPMAMMTPMSAYLQMPHGPWVGTDDLSLHVKHVKRRRTDVSPFLYEQTDAGKKRTKPVKRVNEVQKLEPKRPGNESPVEYVAWVKFQVQPPSMWYRDQKGRQTTFEIEVGLTQADQSLPLESKGYFTVKLLYENGTEVRDQRILDLKEGAFPEANATSTTMKLRINDISSRHQNQKFRVQVSYVSPTPMRVCPALSNAIQVLSKQVKRSAPPPARLPVHVEDVDMADGASNDSEATVAFSSASTSPTASPLKAAAPAAERAATPMDVTHLFRAANPSAVVQWAATAHGVLSQLQWVAQSGAALECPSCKAQHTGPRHLARHHVDCLVPMLLQYPAIFPPSAAPGSPVSSPRIVRPTPLRLQSSDEKAFPGALDLNCLSGSAFREHETHVLKSLSRVSVSDAEPDFGALSTSQLEHFCPPLHADSTHMLSQFTDAPLQSFVEESVVCVGLAPLPPGTRHPAFDRAWTLLGFYHYVAQDLHFEAVSDKDEDAAWLALPELEQTVRKLRARRSRRDPALFPSVGDAHVACLDDVKQLLRRVHRKGS